MLRWEGQVARMGKGDVRKPEGKRLRRRHRRRREDNIEMNLQEVGRGWAWTEFIWFRIGTSGGLL